MSALRVLIADDHTLVRAGIRALLEGFPGIEITAEAEDGPAALRAIEADRPAVALIDVSMPGLNGLELTARSTKKFPETRILILSMHADEEYVHRAFTSGASGYLLKTAERAELEMAVRAVARGDVWVSPSVSRSVVSALAGRATTELELLTPRQREVLQLVAEGHSTKAIARQLHLSAKTVESHRTALMERLGVRGVPALVRYAIRLGLVRPEP